jgi:hypothetical protein
MNKQLTKEECLEAVEYLKRVFYQDSAYAPIVYYYEDGSDYKKMVDVLQQLINEHFDNPPLKFEELKDGMWVWDNKRKYYVKIFDTHEEDRATEIVIIDQEIGYEKVITLGKFEENRFYRHEVKENEDD